MKQLYISLGLVCLLVLGGTSSAMAHDGQCPPWRPCGPGNSWGGNLLVKQGSHGADFRPACEAHDACLASGMYSRRECDQMFYDKMLCVCENSSNPRACARRARCYYVAARVFGGLYTR